MAGTVNFHGHSVDGFWPLHHGVMVKIESDHVAATWGAVVDILLMPSFRVVEDVLSRVVLSCFVLGCPLLIPALVLPGDSGSARSVSRWVELLV